MQEQFPNDSQRSHAETLSSHVREQLGFLHPLAFPDVQDVGELSPHRQRVQAIHEQANRVIEHIATVGRPVAAADVFPILTEYTGIQTQVDLTNHWAQVRGYIAKRYGHDALVTAGRGRSRTYEFGVLAVASLTDESKTTPVAPRASRRHYLFDNTTSIRADWRDQAACTKEDPELFFSSGKESVNRAKAVCASCVVRETCLIVGKSASLGYGVWGGKNYNRFKA